MKSDGILTILLVILVLVVVGSVGYLVATTKSASSSSGSSGKRSLGDSVGNVVDDIYGLVSSFSNGDQKSRTQSN